jgi:molecular chaperone GrpE
MPKGSRETNDEQDDLLAAESEVEEGGSDREPVDGNDQGAAVGGEPAAEAEAVEELTVEEKLRQELQAAREDYLRLAAEFDNFKKRRNRDFAKLVENANEDLITELLEFIDNFSRALDSGENDPQSSAYHKGMKLVYEQLLDILGRYGLTPFDAVGEKFDPNLHEAIMQVESDEYEADQVAQEFLKGYKLNDKVIRHAKVAVATRDEKE